MKSNKNLKVFLIILGLIFVVSTVISNDFSNKIGNISSNDEISEVKNDKNLQTAESWSESGGFIIDDTGITGPTWASAVGAYDWCHLINGRYVIENVTFDAALSSFPFNQ